MAGLGDRFQSCYIAVAAAGKKADCIAARLVIEAVKPLIKGATRLTFALDDTPTNRYGPHVKRAGIHHNPTPGPARSPYVYGHAIVKPAMSLGMTGVSWLRKDAALRTLPGPRPAAQRGRPRSYDPDVIDRRVGSRRRSPYTGSPRSRSPRRYLRPGGRPVARSGWSLWARSWDGGSTSAPTSPLRWSTSWGVVADRSSLEITFRECKQVVGEGQQQLRFL